MNITKRSPEHGKNLEAMPELAERLAQVRWSVTQAEQAIERRFPGALEEIKQQAHPEQGEGQADYVADTPEINGYGHSELTPDNISSIRESINRSATRADVMKPGVENNAQKAA